MEVGAFLNKVYDQSLNLGAELLLQGSRGACLGYFVATLNGANRSLVVQVFAVAAIAQEIIKRCVLHVETDDKKKITRTTIAQALVGLVFLNVVYEMNAIHSSTRTIVGLALIAFSAYRVYKNR